MSSFTQDYPEHIGCQTIYDPSLDKYRPISSSDFAGGAIGGTQNDSFGRLRVSEPFTLFDSSHRFKDNNLWSSATSGTATVVFNSGQGLVDLNIGSGINNEIIRETTKVFAYQPGKSLLTMNTFVMEPEKSGLRQRVGYFGSGNGMYLEASGSSLNFVERTSVSGSLMETRVEQAYWNGDKLDGSGSSGFTLDISKAQISWMDIEWLGVGSVRMGFVINGKFILSHTFHHANIINSTYITSASLPIRYEIKNITATSGTSNLKQICSTVISEGGFSLNGLQQSVTIPITSATALATAGVYYPIISLRLKSGFLDGIVIMTAISIMGVGNGINYNWQVIASGTTAGGSWVSAGSDSCVEYNISGTSFTGGRILACGFLNSSNQGSPTIDILKEALFKFQLERNGLTSTPYELNLVITAATSNQTVFASMDWEEISR